MTGQATIILPTLAAAKRAATHLALVEGQLGIKRRRYGVSFPSANLDHAKAMMRAARAESCTWMPAPSAAR